MKYRKVSFAFLGICFTVSAVSALQLYDTTAKPKLISKQFTFTEGSSVDKQGNVLFTDQPNNKIWEYSVDGKLSVFMEDALHSNGTYFDAKGNLVTCAETKDQLIAINPKGIVKFLAKGSSKPVVVVSDMKKPNGIVGTPDGKYLYIADIEANKTYKYIIAPDG